MESSDSQPCHRPAEGRGLSTRAVDKANGPAEIMQEDDLMSDFPFDFGTTSSADKVKSERRYASKSRDDSSSEDEFDLECRPSKRVKKDTTVADAGQIAETAELSSKAPGDENDDPGEMASISCLRCSSALVLQIQHFDST